MIIHPIFITEERVMINLEEFILNWEIVPIKIEEIATNINIVHGLFFIIINIGMSFCQVAINASISQFIVFPREGIHVWNGAAASLILIAILIIKDGVRRIIIFVLDKLNS